MPAEQQGSVYRERRGTYGIRWVEGSKRPQRGGFKTKTEARAWWRENIQPRLKRGGPSLDITLEQFVDRYMERWGPTVVGRTRRTVEKWLIPSKQAFGEFKLVELEGAADDIARWRGEFSSDDKRHKSTKALRQVLAAAVRWGYIVKNPAVDAGPNHAPRPGEVQPFSREELDRLVLELGEQDAALVVFAAETGLRTNEWVAVERRDVDWMNPAVAVCRRFSDGVATPYPKTSRRRVPLTPRAVEALGWLPARLDTPLLFPGSAGYMNLNNFRGRTWNPALEAAGLERRGPYHLRHTFATEALAAGVSIFQLSRLMGASVGTIEKHYAAFARDSEDSLREILAARNERQEGSG